MHEHVSAGGVVGRHLPRVDAFGTAIRQRSLAGLKSTCTGLLTIVRSRRVVWLCCLAAEHFDQGGAGYPTIAVLMPSPIRRRLREYSYTGRLDRSKDTLDCSCGSADVGGGPRHARFEAQVATHFACRVTARRLVVVLRL